MNQELVEARAYLGAVFPAHAGMNRLLFILVLQVLGVPRACGDEPNEPAPEALAEVCSPRMRG
tara:strand:+ start:10138 stop:10326 length:189 start_codon:yes stop_codon:yes gene_type:complete